MTRKADPDKLPPFQLAFRKHDPFEVMVCDALKGLPHGHGKIVFMRMLRTFFDHCSTVEEMIYSMNDCVNNVTSDQFLGVIKRHKMSMLPSLMDDENRRRPVRHAKSTASRAPAAPEPVAASGEPEDWVAPSLAS